MKVKDERREIRQLSLDEIIEDLKGFGEKPFRGVRYMSGYGKNLPPALRK
jgi:hypothetical protein